MIQDLYHSVKGHKKKIKSLGTPFVSEKVEFMKKRNIVHICQKQIIYVEVEGSWKVMLC